MSKLTAETIASFAISTNAMRMAQATIERAGWELKTAEIDLSNMRARIEVERDGRYVTLDVQHGKASVTREQMDREHVTVGRRGDRSVVTRIRHRFLGREKFLVGGVRSALRYFANYIDENGNGQLAGRQAFSLLLDDATALINARASGQETR